MAEATIILYPPVTNSWMPAFKQTEKARVYFSISNFNNISEIKYAQVTCVSQNTNLSILNRSQFPLGIKMLTYDPNPANMTGFSIDVSRQGDDKYYIEISPNDLQDPEMVNGNRAFYNNQYYKIQIRLASTEAENYFHIDGETPPNPYQGDPSKLYAWNTNNLEKLSEWSRVCIIRPIAEPSINIQTTKTIEEGGEAVIKIADLDPTEENKIPYSFIGLNGKMTFEDGMEQEVLDHFKFILYQNGLEVYNSENIYVDSENPNQITHSLAYNLQNGLDYRLVLDYETNNGYTDTIRYELTIELNEYEDLVARMYVLPDEEHSYMAIWLTTSLSEGQLYVDYNQSLEDAYAIYQEQLQRLSSTAGGEVHDYITIIRASNEDGFTRWEDIHTENLIDYTDINYVYLDYTAEAGVLYKYAIQKRSTSGGRGKPLYEMVPDPEDPSQQIPADPKLYAPEHIYLVTKDTQFPVKLNGDVSSFKYVVSENSTETIGSRYPFVMRNGNVNYRQFNISGMISTLVDLETGETWDPYHETFLPNEYEKNIQKFYGEDFKYYQDYNKANLLDYSNDIIYEKKYRDKAIAFLNNGKPKLFKSTPEGNILVRLMNISLTPEKGLGRMIYSFQATAIEIAACTIENYEKFNIIAPINYFGGVV